jgi:hypothetical protein
MVERGDLGRDDERGAGVMEDADLELVLAACAWYDAVRQEMGGDVNAPPALEAARRIRDEILELRLNLQFYEGDR